MTLAETLATTRIHRVAGLTDGRTALVTTRPGRPPIPVELQALIGQMARDNLTWSQRRIANELRLKLGLWVSPRMVRKYMSTRFDRAPGHRMPSQRWRTFLHDQAWNLLVRGWRPSSSAATPCTTPSR
jgi:hypothetical protein